MKRYENLADEIAFQIGAGVLRAGERIPSVRSTSRNRALSSNTVLQAYHLLEDRGLVKPRARSGYYVCAKSEASTQHVSHSARRSPAGLDSNEELIYELLEAHKIRNSIAFGSALPDTRLFPLQKLARALHAGMRRPEYQEMPSHLPPGNSDLRRQVARRCLEWGFTGSADDVVMTSGSLDALRTCLRAVAASGDFVAIESAAVFAVRSALARYGLKAIEIPSGAHGLSLSALASALKKYSIKACVFMLNFNNPMGSLMPEERKQELVKLLADRGIPLIENDVYGELYYGSRRPRPAKAFDRHGLVLYCSSFSKCLAPGYAVGWSLPGRYTQRVELAKWSSYSTIAAPTQAAIAEYLKHGGYDHHLRRLRSTLAAQQTRMLDAIEAYFPRGTKASAPAGGYSLWVELPDSVRAVTVYKQAIARRITVAPGPVFGSGHKYYNFLRLNYSHRWSLRTDAAMQTLGGIAASLA